MNSITNAALGIHIRIESITIRDRADRKVINAPIHINRTDGISLSQELLLMLTEKNVSIGVRIES